MTAHYDQIGLTYADLRRPDPRIAATIHAALGPAHRVLNVGAGAGSYEPEGREVTALEPSAEMIAQRKTPAAQVIQGRAEVLPFQDHSFDAVMAVLTVHHWQDQARGMAEMQRVSRGPIVILTYDPAFDDFWLYEYFPELLALDQGQMPQMSDYGRWLGPVEIAPVPVPWDCWDGFLCAYWRRPEAYLQARVRAAMSSFHAIGDVSDGLARLETELTNGAWARRYGALLERETCDLGYRLVVAQG